jgi:hypothetical protein
MAGPHGEECGLCKAFDPYDPMEVYGGCRAKGSGLKLCEARAAELVTLGLAPNLSAACTSPLSYYPPAVFFFDWCLRREDGGEFVAKAPPGP